ncbi:ATP-dependent zinc metalloprotease FtsH [Candidatus Johnevansia muelleri]|uniref:ATP-dependent zinc metalloprotease FtsH n=1 Tax=Candidatus Johnevansia muelleri TaxID=1495769 RepID=A0A078KES7_9GAMM|nr:ATP-dependent zinc metalloprotease FtsH [Candidatus Evansia muelleri]
MFLYKIYFLFFKIIFKIKKNIIKILFLLFLSYKFYIKKKIKIIIYSDFLNELYKKNVKKILIDGDYIYGITTNNLEFKTIFNKIYLSKLIKILIKNNINIEFFRQFQFFNFIYCKYFYIIIFILFIIYQIFFNKSNIKKKKNKNKIKFNDIVGCNEAKLEVKEIIDFLRKPVKFLKLGCKIPKGVLLIGPPGTGKTLLAKSISGEANVPFLYISGSDFIEMFVGIGAARVRDIFNKAKKIFPCIIFIDEIDAIGRKRNLNINNEEREQTLNQLLVEMDGFESNNKIIILAATNRPEILDLALLRPGRFDRKIFMNLPDINNRKKIIELYFSKIPLFYNVYSKMLSKTTYGFSGAEIYNIINEAAINSTNKNLRLISMYEIEEAKDKNLIGLKNQSYIIDKCNTAYHESGHTIIALLVYKHNPVYKVTIIPRGKTLGVTMFFSIKDNYNLSLINLKNHICTLLAGRIAEEITSGLNYITIGASNDIKQATELAYNMLAKWGFSSKLGPIMYIPDNDNLNIKYGKFSSSKTYNKFDLEIQKIINNCYLDTKIVLKTKRNLLNIMSKALILYETIYYNQIINIMKCIFI